jgi:hypothetical protein
MADAYERASISAPRRPMKELRFRRGQLAIILNLAIPSLIAASVLGVNLATVYLNWIQLRKSVYGAVVVGASYLPANPSLAIRAARTYANLNGIKTGEIVSTRISPNRTSITMSARRAAPSYLVRAFGLSIAPISATATARIARPVARARAPEIGIRYEQSNPASRWRGPANSGWAGRRVALTNGDNQSGRICCRVVQGL